MDRGQVSVMDLDQLIQVFGFLDLVLELQTSAVEDLKDQNTHSGNITEGKSGHMTTGPLDREHLSSQGLRRLTMVHVSVHLSVHVSVHMTHPGHDVVVQTVDEVHEFDSQ